MNFSPFSAFNFINLHLVPVSLGKNVSVLFILWSQQFRWSLFCPYCVFLILALASVVLYHLLLWFELFWIAHEVVWGTWDFTM